MVYDKDSNNNYISDLCGPPKFEGTYGSGSESYGSNDLPHCFMCAVIIDAHVSNWTDPQAPNAANGGHPPNANANGGAHLNPDGTTSRNPDATDGGELARQ